MLIVPPTKDTDTINEREHVHIKKNKIKQQRAKERDDTMAAITKPSDGAFVLNGSKVKDFFERKTNTSSDALKRFENRRPKDGIVTPFKR